MYLLQSPGWISKPIPMPSSWDWAYIRPYLSTQITEEGHKPILTYLVKVGTTSGETIDTLTFMSQTTDEAIDILYKRFELKEVDLTPTGKALNSTEFFDQIEGKTDLESLVEQYINILDKL